MDRKRILRIVGLGVVALVALGAVGSALGRDEGDGVSTGGAAVEEQPGGDGGNDVKAQIARALGRESAQARPAPNAGAGEAKASALAPQVAPARDAAGPVGAGGPPDALASSADRRIVQTASLRLQVKEVGASFEEVGRVATAAGGFVASSSFSLQGEQQIASVTVRVPADRYQQVLAEVRRLGAKVDVETSNASDVTEEYSDLAARRRNLEATETQLLQLLGQARNISEVLQVQDRVNSIRNEIERVKGRIALLDKLSDLATITVHLRPLAIGVKVDNSNGVNLGAAIDEAWSDSIAFLGGIAEDVLTAVVFVWWLPIVGAPAYVIASRYLRRQAEPAP